MIAEYGELRQLKGGMSPQARGQRFNGLIADLFQVFGVEAQANQYGMGELDVTFTCGGQRFILEAKWEQTKTGTGPIAKLQRRLEQRMVGVHGVFLAMKGYTPDALNELDRGRRLDVLLLDESHWEAMLSGFVPPQELIDRATNSASFRGRAYTSLADLLKQSVPAPTVVFGAPAETGGPSIEHLDEITGGSSADVILSGIDSPQVAIAAEDQTVLLTLREGVLAVDMSKRSARWAAPVAGGGGALLVLPDGSLILARVHGVGRYRDNELRVVSSGAVAADSGKLVLHPDGSIWCLDPGTADSPAKLIKMNSNLGDERWAELPYPPGRAKGAVWLTATDLVVAGNPDLLVRSENRKDRWISLPAGYPAGLIPVDDRRVLTVADDLTLRLTDVPAQQHVELGRPTRLRGPDCGLTRRTNGTILLAGRYSTLTGNMRVAVFSIRLPDQQWSVPSRAGVPRSRAARERIDPQTISAVTTKPPAAVSSPETGTAPAVPIRATPAVAKPVSGPTAASLAGTPAIEERKSEQQRGYLDGMAMAGTMPLYSLEGLVGASFNILRWLQPWRDGWQKIATGQAPVGTPLADWLPQVASHLGSLAAPAEAVEAYFTPSSAYVVGFSDGMRNVWSQAIRERLVPPDDRALGQWLRQPASDTSRGVPLPLRTIDDLRTAAIRAHRKAVWKLVGRVVLWLTTTVFGIVEVFAIVEATVAAKTVWPEHTVTSAVTVNLCCGVPFAGLLWFTIFDLRRMIRGGRKALTDHHRSPTGQAVQPAMPYAPQAEDSGATTRRVTDAPSQDLSTDTELKLNDPLA